MSAARRTDVGRTFRPALATIVAASAAPYGYTVSIWSSGAILMAAHGVPSGAEVAGLIAGALSGFGLLGRAARTPLARGAPLDDPGDRVAAGTLHWLAVLAAIGAVALVARLPGWLAWPLGSLIATTTYLLAAGLQLAIVTARHARLTAVSPTSSHGGENLEAASRRDMAMPEPRRS